MVSGLDTFDMADHCGSAEVITGERLAGPQPVAARAFTKWCPPPGRRGDVRTVPGLARRERGAWPLPWRHPPGEHAAAGGGACGITAHPGDCPLSVHTDGMASMPLAKGFPGADTPLAPRALRAHAVECDCRGVARTAESGDLVASLLSQLPPRAGGSHCVLDRSPGAVRFVARTCCSSPLKGGWRLPPPLVHGRASRILWARAVAEPRR